jgi:hypothetical protein
MLKEINKILFFVEDLFTNSAKISAPRLLGIAVKNCLLILIEKYIVLTLLILINYTCFSQTGNYSETIFNIAEELAEDDDATEAASTYIEYLNELSENPVKINSGNENDLSRLFFLSDFQVKSLADYIRKTGIIVSVYEIAAIPGFDQQTVEMILPFISLKEKKGGFSDSLSVKSTLITNLIFTPGENDTSSLGPPSKVLSKFRITAGRFSAGMTYEKDAGEKFFSGSPPLPEFLSAYSSYSGQGLIKKVILGDFSLRFGAGTCINTAMRTGLHLTSPGFMNERNNLRPYTSTDENNFFRGAAAELSIKNTEIILFYSRNRIDATPELSSDSSILSISSIYKTGLHNTSSLLLKKDLLKETAYGISLSYNLNFIRVGANWSETYLSIPLCKDSGKPENIYDFEGTENRLLSVNYNTIAGRILLYGEASVNNFRNIALVNGIMLRPSDRFSVNFLWRKYSPGFIALNGNGPGNSSSSANEQGMMGNFSFEAAKHLFLSAGCDVTHYPWLKYRCSFPSMSHKEAIVARYLVSEKINLEFSFDHNFYMTNDQKNTGIAGISRSETRTYKFLLRYAPEENSAFTTRINYKMAYPVSSRGILMLQDIYYRFHNVPVTLWFRYCLFSTESWESRLYTYENDILYSLSIPALSGEGSRSYLMAKLDIGHIGELRIKYSYTGLTKKDGDGSFNDELKLQVRIWF